jgi:6-phosphogluconolactonase
MPVPLDVLPNADEAASGAAARIAEWLHAAIAARGVATLALSGGTTPARMFTKLAGQNVDWTRVQIYQVDERVVGASDDSRNLKGMLDCLSAGITQSSRIHAMPVEEADLALASARYAESLRSVAGSPPVLDVVQLGLGADGHTASLLPGDAALEADGDVALTGRYQGFERMTLTFSTINRARWRLFLVIGAAKRAALGRLVAADPSIVASHIARDGTVIVADTDAAGRGARP